MSEKGAIFYVRKKFREIHFNELTLQIYQMHCNVSHIAKRVTVLPTIKNFIKIKKWKIYVFT